MSDLQKGRTISNEQPKPINSSGEVMDQPYRYAKTKPARVFLFALLAAVGAVSLVGAAWAYLEGATEKNRLAEPPDLKGVVESASKGGKQIVGSVRDDLQPLGKRKPGPAGTTSSDEEGSEQ